MRHSRRIVLKRAGERPAHLRRTALALACLAMFSTAQQCSVAPVIRILAPAAGASLTRMPLSIEIDTSDEALPGTLSVRLNGTDISDRFVTEAPVGGRIFAYADFVWGGAFVLEGANALVVSVELQGSPGTVRRVGHAFEMHGDPYADAVESFSIGAYGGFGLANLDAVVLGPPVGAGLFGGGLDVFSLGLLGEIVLAFDDNIIVDGPGVDFTVFENPFFGTGAFEVIDALFSEAGEVSVSQDGSTWFTYPCANTLADAPLYAGCAGVYPVLANGESDARHPSVPTFAPPVEDFLGTSKPDVVVPEGSGGDSFDLADVGLAWARFVRIRAADHVNGPFGPDNAGFDLDAVAAVHAAPATDADGNGVPDAVE
ncbi:MAG: hypothetical protein OEM49_02210 [Myxococcales bacterium]|nr:hypothetical protein [Myxococcales bacterium]MDH5306619.1 hypothetical protein [Myxococcales bacterium]